MSDRVTAVPLLALRWGLAALLLAACATPALTVSAPGLGVPRITAFEIVPTRIDSGCPVTFRIDYEDSGADVTRAVMRWRSRTSGRYHEGTDAVPIATSEPAGRTAGHADLTIVPPHAGAWLYRIQLENAEGRTSNVADARVDVLLQPLWREAHCDAPGPAPRVSRVAILSHRAGPTYARGLQELETATRALGLQQQVIEIRDASEFDDAFAAMKTARADAIFVPSNALLYQHGAWLAQLAAQTRWLGVVKRRRPTRRAFW